MAPGFTLEEKNIVLKTMREESRQLGQKIDTVVRMVEQQDRPRGCGASLCNLLLRLRGQRSQRVATVEITPASCVVEDAAFSRAVFGLAGAKGKEPAKKLDEAAEVMRNRIQQLEARAREHRSDAARLAKSGQKTLALRALRKAKQVETQIGSNQASIDAVEQQVDLLAQAAMQKTLTHALASTSKAMKGDAKLLSKAENAIDAASEARDVASDLNSVVSEFACAGAGDVDEEGLEMELAALMEEEPPLPPDVAEPKSANTTNTGDTALYEANRIEQEYAQLSEARRLRAAFPSAPRVSGKGATWEERGVLSTA
jgi:predicted ribosome quality control (RQC) complex YloA/Tae2 family protein